MSKLAPTSDGEYTRAEIERELTRWGKNLAKAKDDGDILAVDTASRFVDCWLDRLNALRAAA